MVQNGTKTDHLEPQDGLGPEIVQNGTETDNLERLGGLGPEMVKNSTKTDHAALGPKWSKMVPTNPFKRHPPKASQGVV